MSTALTLNTMDEFELLLWPSDVMATDGLAVSDVSHMEGGTAHSAASEDSHTAGVVWPSLKMQRSHGESTKFEPSIDTVTFESPNENITGTTLVIPAVNNPRYTTQSDWGA